MYVFPMKLLFLLLFGGLIINKVIIVIISYQRLFLGDTNLSGVLIPIRIPLNLMDPGGVLTGVMTGVLLGVVAEQSFVKDVNIVLSIASHRDVVLEPVGFDF